MSETADRRAEEGHKPWCDWATHRLNAPGECRCGRLQALAGRLRAVDASEATDG